MIVARTAPDSISKASTGWPSMAPKAVFWMLMSKYENADSTAAWQCCRQWGGSVDFGLRHAAGPFQEVEVAAFVRLADVLSEELVVAARVIARRRRPGAQAVLD